MTRNKQVDMGCNTSTVSSKPSSSAGTSSSVNNSAGDPWKTWTIKGASYYVPCYRVGCRDFDIECRYDPRPETVAAAFYTFDGKLLKVVNMQPDFRPTDDHRCSIYFGAHIDPNAKLPFIARLAIYQNRFLMCYDKNDNALTYYNYDRKTSLLGDSADRTYDEKTGNIRVSRKVYSIVDLSKFEIDYQN